MSKTNRRVAMNQDSARCPLCDSAQTSIRRSLSNEEILKCWTIDGHQFSAEAIQNLLAESMIHQYTCLQCGFEFFDPKLAAGERFYEELQAGGQGYYADDRPENQRNVRFAVRRGYRTLLDVGCGTGFALDVARKAGLQTFGIEVNRIAAAEASRRGHTVFSVLLENLGQTWHAKFDLISLNQLLEHVPDPVGLVGQCVPFLSPQGAIAIAVPDSNGILRFTPWLESNWPPHHLTRWRSKNFETLARR